MSALPFSPLTHDELNRRAAVEREACGYVAGTIVRQNSGVFDDWAHTRLREHATRAIAYHDAAMARVQR